MLLVVESVSISFLSWDASTLSEGKQRQQPEQIRQFSFWKIALVISRFFVELVDVALDLGSVHLGCPILRLHFLHRHRKWIFRLNRFRISITSLVIASARRCF